MSELEFRPGSLPLYYTAVMIESCPPPKKKRYVGVLTPITSECDYLDIGFLGSFDRKSN